jgi:nickel/cobalt exporter
MKLSLIYSPCRGHLLASLLLVFTLGLSSPVAAWAHPLGNFTINRYSRLEVDTHQVRVRYVIDMAEIPTFQERARMDLNHDNTMSATEQDRYLVEAVAALQSRLYLVSNGEAIALQPQEQQLEFLPGQGDLQTLRLSLWFAAKLPQHAVWQAVWQVEYRDDNFAGRIGWQEVIVQATADASLLESNVPTQDLSNELRSYPQDLL